jgi:hypothetical protein
MPRGANIWKKGKDGETDETVLQLNRAGLDAMKSKSQRMTQARNKRTSSLPMADSAMPTQERLQQAKGAFQIGGDRRCKIFRMLDAPLEQIFSQQKISDLQYEALRQLRVHWYLGQLAGMPRSIDMNRVTVDWNGLGQSERELMHRQAYDIGWRELARLEQIAVNAVVLVENPLAVAGLELGYRSPYRGRVAVLELLRSAAAKLVKAWRI